jgi:hypothetical protein
MVILDLSFEIIKSKKIFLLRRDIGQAGSPLADPLLKAQFSMLEMFRCRQRTDKMAWNSAYVTLIFRACYDEYTDEYGDLYDEGLIEMKIFAQGCRNCEIYTAAQFDYEGWYIALYWLHIWILKQYYGIQFPELEEKDTEWRFTPPHDVGRCEACATMCCNYRDRQKIYML